MFSGFWSWVLVILVVVAIFSADRLPELKKLANEGIDALKKGKKSVEEKIAEAKAKAAQKKTDNEE